MPLGFARPDLKEREGLELPGSSGFKPAPGSKDAVEALPLGFSRPDLELKEGVPLPGEVVLQRQASNLSRSSSGTSSVLPLGFHRPELAERAAEYRESIASSDKPTPGFGPLLELPEQDVRPLSPAQKILRGRSSTDLTRSPSGDTQELPL